MSNFISNLRVRDEYEKKLNQASITYSLALALAPAIARP